MMFFRDSMTPGPLAFSGADSHLLGVITGPCTALYVWGGGGGRGEGGVKNILEL